MAQITNVLPKVRQQYEEYPYPERNPEHEKTRLIVPYFSRLDIVSHQCFGGKQDFKNFRVLIAGGGTGDSLILWAQQLQGKAGAEVVYLDMSAASMEIAKKRALVRKLTNIKWVHDSLLNLPQLGLGAFDFINCTGVLHHLENPDAGLQALKSVLKPEGAMNLMVYAPYGRAGVYQIQNLMRLVNGNEQSPQKKVKNAREILKSLPQHHWFNIVRQIGWGYSDADHDAGIHDLFLHTQDRAYTILEVHDWLEKAGLKMSGEPGFANGQMNYIPQSFIKDKALLEEVNRHPLKVRQAIGEAIANKIQTHEFFVVAEGRENPAATLAGRELIPWEGIAAQVTFEKLAGIAEKHNDDFTITFDAQMGKPSLSVPKGKHVPALLRAIDGKKSVGEIVEELKKAGGAEPEIMADFEKLLVMLNRGHALFLRHPSVEPYTTIQSFDARIKTLYAS